MNQELLRQLSVITEEERSILSGSKEVNRALYYDSEKSRGASNEIDYARVLTNGKLIDLRPHVRFIHFPRHTHNFVEFIYMCQGSTTHIIDGQTIVLREGDLLFLNQHAAQEILPAGENDIAVNFMILPEFFDTAFRMMGNEDNALRTFIISCLTEQNRGGNYLYFQVADVLPIQNLMENLIWIMKSDLPNRRSLSQHTMGLLFLLLTNYADKISVSGSSYEQNMIIHLLSYVENNYKNASLSVFAQQNSIDDYTLSRMIKKNTGSTFKELLQEKRLNQSCFLLTNTDLSVADIAIAVGYDNTSFFHRLFRRTYDMSPKEYRAKEGISSDT
ncbi:MAG: helix-turn-helix domain-containing protein [Lachnospiraceae bacterium]|nr:helix-turn-helix domain-containing protein [Lachnospiraceae bacterium]